MVIFFGTIGAAISVIFVVLVVRHILIVMQLLKATIHDPSTNDNDSAIANFTDLLERARVHMIVYDDGKKMAGSVYMKQEVIAAVQEKLQTIPSFTMRCYFNYDDPNTLFRQTFDKESRVEIWVRDDNTRPDDTHYKIIDDGRMAYLSKHGEGISKRKFQMVDCSGVRKSALGTVTNSLLGEYKKDIEQKKLSFHPAP